MYGDADGFLPSTFHVIYFIGWKEGPGMAKPAKRGSANASLKNIDDFVSSQT